MFSRYRKPAAAPPPAQPAEPAAPAPAPTAPSAPVMRRPIAAPAKPAPAEREKRRIDKLNEVKLEVHRALLDTLNLAALDTASEADLRRRDRGDHRRNRCQYGSAD